MSMPSNPSCLASTNRRSTSLSSRCPISSHPVSPSRPSEEDKRLAYDSSASYMILSLMEEEPVLNSFHIEGDKAEKEQLVIADE